MAALGAKPPAADGTRFGEKDYQAVEAGLTELGRRVREVEAELKVIAAPGKLPAPADPSWQAGPDPFRRLAAPIAV